MVSCVVHLFSGLLSRESLFRVFCWYTWNETIPNPASAQCDAIQPIALTGTSKTLMTPSQTRHGETKTNFRRRRRFFQRQVQAEAQTNPINANVVRPLYSPRTEQSTHTAYVWCETAIFGKVVVVVVSPGIIVHCTKENKKKTGVQSRQANCRHTRSTLTITVPCTLLHGLLVLSKSIMQSLLQPAQGLSPLRQPGNPSSASPVPRRWHSRGHRQSGKLES